MDYEPIEGVGRDIGPYFNAGFLAAYIAGMPDKPSVVTYFAERTVRQ